MNYTPNENLHTLRGELPGVHMDTKNDGGIHLWLVGELYPEQMIEGGKVEVSVHLTREQAIFLAKEILYRVVSELQSRINDILQMDL